MPLIGVGAAPIAICLNESRGEADSFSLVVYCLILLTQVGVGAAPVVVGLGQIRINEDGLVEVLDSPRE